MVNRDRHLIAGQTHVFLFTGIVNFSLIVRYNVDEFAIVKELLWHPLK